jgi:hypothetical protein
MTPRSTSLVTSDMATMDTAVCDKFAKNNDIEEQSKVSFSHIEMRDYEIKMGNNPSCTSGPPLELGWRYNKVSPITIDTYEETRGPRRDRTEMMVPSHYRKEKLMEFGYTSRDINEMLERLTLEKKKMNKSTSGVKPLSKLMHKALKNKKK